MEVEALEYGMDDTSLARHAIKGPGWVLSERMKQTRSERHLYSTLALVSPETVPNCLATRK